MTKPSTSQPNAVTACTTSQRDVSPTSEPGQAADSELTARAREVLVGLSDDGCALLCAVVDRQSDPRRSQAAWVELRRAGLLVDASIRETTLGREVARLATEGGCRRG